MDLIRIGVIVNTFGIRGDLKVKSLSDFNDERYKKNNKVLLKYEGEYLEMTVARYRIHKGMVLVTFKDYEDINLVEKFKNCELFVDRNKIAPLKDGEYYRFELVGLDAYDTNNNYLGRVSRVEDTLANSNLRIEKDGKSFLVPNVKSFVLDVDLENKKILINVIEGLI